MSAPGLQSSGSGKSTGGGKGPVRRSSVVLLAVLAITVSAATVMLAMQQDDRESDIDPSVLAAEATVESRMGGSAIPESREGMPERVDRRGVQKP